MPDYLPLELVFAPPSRARTGPVVLLPQATGAGADRFARAIVGSFAHGWRRLVPAPPLDAGVSEQRAWHRDLWLAMAETDRRAVALIMGPTAAHLAPFLEDAARTLALVVDPLEALRAQDPAELPRKRTLERLGSPDVPRAPERVRHVANQQSRALLAPWYDTGDLAVSAGVPPDGDRWRVALFEDVLSRVGAVAVEQASDLARELAELVGAPPKPLVRAARSMRERVDGEGLDDEDLAELLRRVNWLDAELHERCGARAAHQP
jgi:hypothetical protein